jgi:hypothetical protein
VLGREIIATLVASVLAWARWVLARNLMDYSMGSVTAIADYQVNGDGTMLQCALKEAVPQRWNLLCYCPRLQWAARFINCYQTPSAETKLGHMSVIVTD